MRRGDYGETDLQRTEYSHLSLPDDIPPSFKLLAFLLCPCSGGIAFYGGYIPHEAEGQLWRQVGMVWRGLFSLLVFICFRCGRLLFFYF